MSVQFYNHNDGKGYVEQLGMAWDEEFAMRADKMAHEHGLSQAAWDAMVREYAWRVKCMFQPKTYPWRVRVMIAIHFLNPFK